MKYTQYDLTAPQPLIVHGVEVGTVERRDYDNQINGLRITDKDGRVVDLPSGVDVSEQLDEPHIFIIEGAADGFFVFGGEIAYWVSTDLTQVSRLDLFRGYSEAEYWTTTILEQPQSLIIIYEAGVLVINEALTVLTHDRKLINDFFVAVEDTGIRFLRDHDEEWLMPLGDTTERSS